MGQKGLHHRTAGLERAVLMPSADWLNSARTSAQNAVW